MFSSSSSARRALETTTSISHRGWKTSSEPNSLATGDVDVWKVELDRDDESTASLIESLSSDEIERANRFVFAKDRNRFIACRAELRNIMGGYLGIEPQKIRFSVRKYGKPYLSTPSDPIRFNVSHSKDVAVIAVAFDREIGVDLEFINQNFDVFSVAPSIFPAEEVSRMRTLPRNELVEHFFGGWTRKEALLKAFGDGLSSPEELQLAVANLSLSKMAFKTFAAGRSREWSLRTFRINDDFECALAHEGPIENFRFWKLKANA